MNVLLRRAERQDISAIYALIKELAAYEKAPNEVSVTIEELEKDGFGKHAIWEAVLAEYNKTVIGMALYFYSYSTWKGKCIYLEDIIVKEEFRGNQVGKKLFEAVILKGKETGAKRMQWQVLDWNEPAINFYRKYNASIDPTWLTCKLTQEQIQLFSV